MLNHFIDRRTAEMIGILRGCNPSNGLDESGLFAVELCGYAYALISALFPMIEHLENGLGVFFINTIEKSTAKGAGAMEQSGDAA